MIEYTVKVYNTGSKSWWLNGKHHREDGPAIERANGNKEWYLNGKRHREDGPAIERFGGSKSWWLNGKEWWLNDIQYTEEKFNAKMKPVKEYSIEELQEILGHKIKIKE